MFVGKGLHIVGEVLPLIIDRGARCVALAHVVAVLCGVAVEGQARRRIACATQTITEARGDGHVGDECEVAVDRSRHVEALILRQVVVAHHQRVVLLTLVELGGAVVVAVIVRQQVLALSDQV